MRAHRRWFRWSRSTSRATADSGSRCAGASLVVRPGEIVGIAAVEGNGQRELLRAVAGRIMPLRGRRQVAEPIAFIPEDRTTEGLIPEMTLTENVVLGSSPSDPWLRGRHRGLAQPRAEPHDGAARGVRDRRAERRRSPAAALSGGNQQRVVRGARAVAAARACRGGEPHARSRHPRDRHDPRQAPPRRRRERRRGALPLQRSRRSAGTGHSHRRGRAAASLVEAAGRRVARGDRRADAGRQLGRGATRVAGSWERPRSSPASACSRWASRLAGYRRRAPRSARSGRAPSAPGTRSPPRRWCARSLSSSSDSGSRSAFRAGAFNIGAEGQFYAGAIAATWLGLHVGLSSLAARGAGGALAARSSLARSGWPFPCCSASDTACSRSSARCCSTSSPKRRPASWCRGHCRRVRGSIPRATRSPSRRGCRSCPGRGCTPACCSRSSVRWLLHVSLHPNALGLPAARRRAGSARRGDQRPDRQPVDGGGGAGLVGRDRRTRGRRGGRRASPTRSSRICRPATASPPSRSRCWAGCIRSAWCWPACSSARWRRVPARCSATPAYRRSRCTWSRRW